MRKGKQKDESCSFSSFLLGGTFQTTIKEGSPTEPVGLTEMKQRDHNVDSLVYLAFAR